MLRTAIQNGTATNRRNDGFSADVDKPDDLGTGLHHCQSPCSGTGRKEVNISTEGTAAGVSRQHRFTNFWRRSMAGGKAWREVAPYLAQAASGSRCGQWLDRHAGSHRSVYGRPVSGGPLLDQIDEEIGKVIARRRL